MTDVDYQAARPGDLEATGASAVGGVELPAGHLVEVDPSFITAPEKAPAGPVAWVSDEPVADAGQLWSDLAARFAETGLWPLVLEPLSFDGRRWWDGELDPTMSRQPDEVDAIDLEPKLASWWTAAIPSAEELEGEDSELIADVLAPFGTTFPGMAPERPGRDVPPDTTIAVAGSYVGLVAVERPADAIAVMGWSGPVNYYNDVGPLVALLRSWEDRYDAVVVGLGLDAMSVAVRRPPRTADDALALTAEHFAACPDLVWQGTASIPAYASALQGQTTWGFWWD